jgi:hypothetical protein
MQFQRSPYSDHQTHYDISSVNNDKAAFPSPITTSSLDSPPNNKMNNINPYMPLPNSPKSYNSMQQAQQQQQQQQQQHHHQQQQPQYDMSSYMPAPNNFPHPISIPQSNNNNNEIKSSPSPHQQYYGASSVPDNNGLSDTLVSPTSPNSNDEEIVQRK